METYTHYILVTEQGDSLHYRIAASCGRIDFFIPKFAEWTVSTYENLADMKRCARKDRVKVVKVSF